MSSSIVLPIGDFWLKLKRYLSIKHLSAIQSDLTNVSMIFSLVLFYTRKLNCLKYNLKKSPIFFFSLLIFMTRFIDTQWWRKKQIRTRILTVIVGIHKTGRRFCIHSQVFKIINGNFCNDTTLKHKHAFKHNQWKAKRNIQENNEIIIKADAVIVLNKTYYWKNIQKIQRYETNYRLKEIQINIYVKKKKNSAYYAMKHWRKAKRTSSQSKFQKLHFTDQKFKEI